MGAKIAAPEVNFEEVAPMVVVVGGEIEGNGDIGTNIGDCIGEGEHRRHRWWLW